MRRGLGTRPQKLADCGQNVRKAVIKLRFHEMTITMFMQYSEESEVEGFEAIPPHKRTLKVLLSPQKNQTKNISMGMTVLDPGWSSSSHSHETEEEIWFVLDGTGLATVGEESIRIRKGTAIYVPPTKFHHLENDGNEQMRVLWVFSPPGPETAFLSKKGGIA